MSIWKGLAAAVLLSFLPLRAGAQLATSSVDPVGDSLAFVKMHRKLDRIRRTDRPCSSFRSDHSTASMTRMQTHWTTSWLRLMISSWIG